MVWFDHLMSPGGGNEVSLTKNTKTAGVKTSVALNKSLLNELMSTFFLEGEITLIAPQNI